MEMTTGMILVDNTKKFSRALRRFRHMLLPWQENYANLAEQPTAWLWITARDGAPTESLLQVAHDDRILQVREDAGLFINRMAGYPLRLGLPFWTLFSLFVGRRPQLGAETDLDNWRNQTLEEARATQVYFDSRKAAYSRMCEKWADLDRVALGARLRFNECEFRQVVRPRGENQFGFLACDTVGPRQLDIPPVTANATVTLAEGMARLTLADETLAREQAFVCDMQLAKGKPIVGPQCSVNQIVADGESFYDVLSGKRRYMNAFPKSLMQRVLWKPSETKPIYLYETQRYLALGCPSQRLLVVRNNARPPDRKDA